MATTAAAAAAVASHNKAVLSASRVRFVWGGLSIQEEEREVVVVVWLPVKTKA